MKKKSNANSVKIIITAVVLLSLLLITYVIKVPNSSGGASNPASVGSGGIKTVKDSDIVIPVNSVTETASFYPAEIKGTKLEVLAIKASDGSVRTAFNTCQVCYSSGKGYYKQEGNELVCQNCGNRFSADQVEVTKGGCNPVPILPENKTVDNDNITISKDFLEQATVIFANWKN